MTRQLMPGYTLDTYVCASRPIYAVGEVDHVASQQRHVVSAAVFTKSPLPHMFAHNMDLLNGLPACSFV